MSENIFLSKPGFICAAGDSKNPEQFIENLENGNRDGIKVVEPSIAGENGAKKFYVGKIEDSKLKPTGDKFDMRVLQILDFALDGISGVVQKAISKYGKNRVGACIGSCDNGTELSMKGHRAFFGSAVESKEGHFPENYDLKMQGADYVAGFTSKKFGVTGPSLAFSTACSSSASAIIKAKELILSGICDAVIAGGVDIVSDTVLLGFDSLEAIDHRMTNPFSKNRSGINLGEGASVFVLSKDDLDETGIILAGSGESSDASHMTAPLADGTGAEQAMNAALREAKLDPSEIDYINLHGTGTHLNDSMESRGVELVFKTPAEKTFADRGEKSDIPNETKNLPLCSSTKPMMGHTLGAAGSLELAVCFYAIKEQKLPLHLWDGLQDEEMPEMNFVKKIADSTIVRCCMSNSFAFGGCNASLIIKSLE
ncbi:MAG: 3-oxoacyl-ACP synthase [Treponema sp.]|nr:3-oxoacyl-ACP synthase [Treponema sp.]